MFQSLSMYFKPITNNVAMAWKHCGLSAESIKPPATSGNLNDRLDNLNKPKFRKQFSTFNERCLKTNTASFNYKTKNLCITYEIKIIVILFSQLLYVKKLFIWMC